MSDEVTELMFLDCTEDEWFEALETGVFQDGYHEMETKARSFLNSENFSLFEDRRTW